MSWDFFHKPTPLPVDEETAQKIEEAMRNDELLDFAKKHPLSPAHFLVVAYDRARKLTISAKMPLYTAAIQGKLGQVVEALELLGEQLHLEHFLMQNKWGRSPLHGAAWGGHLDQVVEALKPSGQQLTAEAFLVEQDGAKTPLDYAIQENHLDQVFTPSFWAGRVGEMLRLWQRVPEKERGQIDFDAAVQAAIRESSPAAPPWKAEDYAGAVRSPAVGSERGDFSQGKVMGI